MKLTAGVAQGSILGPDLWNVSNDGLLMMEMPEETCLVWYTDVATLIAVHDVELVQLKLTDAVGQLMDGRTWIVVGSQQNRESRYHNVTK